GMLGATKGLAYACDALEELDAAIAWETMALQLAEASEDEEEAAGSRSYLGYAYLNAEEYEIAREHLLVALAWQQEYGEPSQMAITYYNLADTYRYLNEPEKAWQSWERGMKLAKQYKPDLVSNFKELREKLGSRESEVGSSGESENEGIRVELKNNK
ncbi:MAG: tetratricopeptide repeat protein, partial [Cyanobacteria bacterium P01_E01_bin.42]